MEKQIHDSRFQSVLRFLMKIREKMNDLTYTILLMAISTILAFLLFFLTGRTSDNITLIYILALILTARYTKGYYYGICSSIIYVIMVNYFFTYPYFKLNFTLTGYPITFCIMLFIAVITCATTSHLQIQSKLLQDREDVLRKADKEKMRANLLRAISHDLRTPLTSIIGTSSMILENYESYDDDEKQTLIKHVIEDSTWLLHMVENLLSITRIQDQDTETKVKKTEEAIEEVIAEAIQRFKKRIPEAKLAVTIPEELVIVPMDALLIEQVIINLLENAWQHSESKKPIQLKITESDTYVSFEIRDYGIGLSEEQLSSIFDETVSNKSAIISKNLKSQDIDSHKGMGIGLSICKTIVNAHKGTIIAINCDPGAKFVFTLPKEDNHDH